MCGGCAFYFTNRGVPFTLRTGAHPGIAQLRQHVVPPQPPQLFSISVWGSPPKQSSRGAFLLSASLRSSRGPSLESASLRSRLHSEGLKSTRRHSAPFTHLHLQAGKARKTEPNQGFGPRVWGLGDFEASGLGLQGLRPSLGASAPKSVVEGLGLRSLGLS